MGADFAGNVSDYDIVFNNIVGSSTNVCGGGLRNKWGNRNMRDYLRMSKR